MSKRVSKRVGTAHSICASHEMHNLCITETLFFITFLGFATVCIQVEGRSEGVAFVTWTVTPVTQEGDAFSPPALHSHPVHSSRLQGTIVIIQRTFDFIQGISQAFMEQSLSFRKRVSSAGLLTHEGVAGRRTTRQCTRSKK